MIKYRKLEKKDKNDFLKLLSNLTLVEDLT